VNRWHAIWRAVTKSRLSVVLAVAMVAALVTVVELVMMHNYRISAQLGPDRGFELAPAGAMSGSLHATRP
jgi:hypothetical protein